MKTKTFILLALLGTLIVCAAGRPARAAEAPASVSLTPETLEEKVAMADFVVVGVVKSVAPLPGQGTKFSKPLIEEMTAEVEIKEVLKGALGSGKVTVEFKRSGRPSTPPRPVLAAGETALLFLKGKPGGAAFQFITPFAGKESVGLKERAAALVKSLGQTAGAQATLTLAGEKFAPGAPVAFTAVVANTGGVPVTLYTYIVPSRDIVVTRADGTVVSPAKAAQPPAPAREHFTTLQPGPFIGLAGDLAAIFPLGAGSYTATFNLKCPPGAAAGVAAWSGALAGRGVAFKIGGGS